MKINLMFVCLLASFTLQAMDHNLANPILQVFDEKNIRKNIILFSDIFSARDLSLTCKSYQDTFHEAIEDGSFYDYAKALQLPFFNSLQFNYHVCTDLLISYACLYRDINIQLQQIPSTIKNLKDINTLKYQRKKYKNRFNSLWRYSPIDRSVDYNHDDVNSDKCRVCVRGASILQIMEGYDQYIVKKPSLKIEIYSGIFLKGDLIPKAFRIFLELEEFALIKPLVRANIKFFGNSDEGQYSTSARYSVRLFSLYKKTQNSALVSNLIQYGIENGGQSWFDVADGDKILHLAWEKKDKKMIEFLIGKGVKCRQTTYKELSNDSEIFEYLLSVGYYTEEQTRELLGLAVVSKNEEYKRILQKFGLDIKKVCLVQLCQGELMEIVKEVIRDNDDLVPSVMQNKLWGNVLYYTVLSSNNELLTFLCKQKNTDVNMRAKLMDTFTRYNGLTQAIQLGKFDAAKILLDHGADINDEIVMDLLKKFKYPRDAEKIKFMLDNGMDISKAIEIAKEIDDKTLLKLFNDHSSENGLNRLSQEQLFNKEYYHTSWSRKLLFSMSFFCAIVILYNFALKKVG